VFAAINRAADLGADSLGEVIHQFVADRLRASDHRSRDLGISGGISDLHLIYAEAFIWICQTKAFVNEFASRFLDVLFFLPSLVLAGRVR
jgi:hypothetical protein